MKRSSTWFALILIALVLLPSVAPSANNASKTPRRQQHPNQAAAQNELTETEKSEAKSLAALAQIAESAHRDAIAAYAHYQADQNSYSSPAMIVQIVLSIIGVLYVGTALLQWCAINRQANLIEETLAIDIRPRIGVKIDGGHAPLSLTGSGTQQFVLYYKVRNAGRGPAFITRQNQCFFYLTDPNDPLPTKPPEYPYDTPIRGIIDGNDDVPCDVGSEQLSSEKFDRINKGEIRAFWMVLIEYRDERNKPHVYRITSTYEPNSGCWIYPPNAPDSWSEST